MNVAEYVGLNAEALTRIEGYRESPVESRSDIILRALPQNSMTKAPTSRKERSEMIDFGQGARLAVGERPLLFLSEAAKRTNRPDAVAEICRDGFYLDGKKIEPSRGSVLQPAMARVQMDKNHRNGKGELVSLSAWRQWHVMRDGKLTALIELKDPELARTRTRPITLRELGL